uniref:Uncharacterized protein n=1 Tax=Mycena chlorophos TaxID=658473 RepID=A0ABQ0KXR9_MYCCL|nr:predicted protein [Mycena chlorophos]
MRAHDGESIVKTPVLVQKSHRGHEHQRVDEQLERRRDFNKEAAAAQPLAEDEDVIPASNLAGLRCEDVRNCSNLPRLLVYKHKSQPSRLCAYRDRLYPLGGVDLQLGDELTAACLPDSTGECAATW